MGFIFENINVDEIKPCLENNKKYDQKEIDTLAESIRICGLVQPIALNKDNVVIDGHCRLLAVKQLGMKEVRCMRFVLNGEII